jgi:hypothetical protein
VHVRISAPPTENPCYYGIDTPTRKELIASSHTQDEIVRYLGADSLGYLSVVGLNAVAASPRNTYCDACFTGKSPVEFPEAARAERRGLWVEPEPVAPWEFRAGRAPAPERAAAFIGNTSSHVFHRVGCRHYGAAHTAVRQRRP